MPAQSFKGKYIWIIGASSGIGAALAQELSRLGAIIALSARREEKLEEVKGLLQGGDHLVVSIDVADEASVSNACDKIGEHFPRIDSVIFMPALYTPHDGRLKPISLIRDMVEVNFTSAYSVLYAVLPHFRKQGFGQIALCASVAGYRGLPTGQPYCATKAALISLAESWKLDFAGENIDVRVICPGFVKTPLTDKNDFHMPMMISSERAAQYIAKGLLRNAFEIHFPKKFTVWAKFIRIVPNGLYFIIARRFRR